MYHSVSYTHLPQSVSQIIMFAAEYQQAFARFVFPVIRGLVVIQRIHAVMGVDIGKQEFHAVFQKGVPLPHRDAVDIGVHSGFHRLSLIHI